jgi:iron complex transport system permease protein
MKKLPIPWIIWIVIFIVVLVVVGVISLLTGSSDVSIQEVFSTISQGRGTAEYSILFDIRLPRILLGFAIGGALSLAGVLLQGMFRNPLVEPYTLGISGGAALGVSLNIVFNLHHTMGSLTLPLSGFAGAILIILFVYLLSTKKGALNTQGLLLAGVMLSFICSSLIMLIMAVTRAEELHGIVFWIMGSLQSPDWTLVKAMLLVSVLGLGVSYLFCHDLNALSLGEEEAFHLGINVENTKRLLFFIASFLTGFSVSIGGIIGFVGLVVPHFVRMFIGNDHRILLICSFLCGAAFLIFCDTLARTVIAPIELPVGVITGIVGGSLFVYALTRKQVVLGK